VKNNEKFKGIFQNPARLVRYSLLPVILIILWYYSTGIKEFFPPALLPDPVKVLMSMGNMIFTGELFRHIYASMLRIFYAILVACFFGIPLGLFMGIYHKFEELIDGVLTIIRPIPPLAWIPLAILWFGIGNMSVVFITCLSAFFAVLLNTIGGVRAVDRVLVRAAESLGADQKILIWRVILPASLPSIFTGFRIAIGVSWMSIVAAELVAASSGLGYMISFYREFMRTDLIIVGMITIGIIGLIMDWITRRLEDWLLPWRVGITVRK